MIFQRLSYFLILFGFCTSAQQSIEIDASIDTQKNIIHITQKVIFQNSSNDTLNEVFFFDWANSFSSKTTPLAKKFARDYKNAFHFAPDSDRGMTIIKKVISENNKSLGWTRGDEVDILKVFPEKSILPNSNYTFNLQYDIKIPNERFTRYGVTKDGEYKLRYWFLSPAVYDGEWQIYSNTDSDDLYMLPSNFNISLKFPSNYILTSDLNEVSENIEGGIKTVHLSGKKRRAVPIYLDLEHRFFFVETDNLTINTDIDNDRLQSPFEAVIIDRISHFLQDKLGPYPFNNMLIADNDYRSNPVYGLNLLPSFISPFPDGFEYDMEQFKTISRHYVNNTFILHSRKDYWLQNAIQIYLMMEYVDTFYPKMKILGNFSNWWVVRWAHAADLDFNDQYQLLYMNMARLNIHQSLAREKDSLLKFNMNIANPYYGASGLKYLEDYVGKNVLQNTIKEFYLKNQLKPVIPSDFEKLLAEKTKLPVNWFFEDFVHSEETIDFKIKRVVKKKDSLEVFIHNKKQTHLPVSLYGLNKKEIVYKGWVKPFDSITSITIPSKSIRKLALNYEGIIPEYNQRDNFKSVKGFLDKPVQFRLFQDVEDSHYNQIFFMPIFQYNLYDGLAMGVQLYNKTFLPKELHYSVEPQVGLKSNTLVGSASILYNQHMNEENLYAIRYGFAGNYYSYDKGLFYKRFSPYLIFAFRPDDLRKSERQYINIRSVTVHRDENIKNPDQAPNFSVFNAQYVYTKPHMVNYFRSLIDYQVSSKFSKLSLQLEYRKLFVNNRQINLRFFAGTFLFNDSKKDGDYFSFALDRPSDYLFDYNYYGRSEDTGLFSQQLVIAEGGFKSKLKPAYANSWIATLNASTNIWRWIYAYGDVGLVHNSGEKTKAVFDSGIRLSLVADYFEIYFPMYSNLGFEPNLPDYDEKIRFIITLRPETLFKLFTRRWY